MGEVWKALGFLALGALVNEWHNRRVWQKYYDGRRGK